MKPDNPYSYQPIKIPQKRVQRVLGQDFTITQHLFKFRDSDNQNYIAILEEYPEKVYAFKFYAKALKGKSQYNKLTGFNRPFRVLSTCIHILLDFYKKSEPLASFCFVGAELYEKEDNRSHTKRFRVWSMLVSQQVSEKKFVHRQYPEKSAYMFVNRKHIAEKPELLSEIEDAFNQFLDSYFLD